MQEKHGYLLKIEQHGITGIGECSYIEGLSIDPLEAYESKLLELSKADDFRMVHLSQFPSIQCGLEMALLDWQNGGIRKYFDSPFYSGAIGIPINGLLWMGNLSYLNAQLEEKLQAGFRCIKMKVGALPFEQECSILEQIRNRFDASQLELRLDANGAFTPDIAHERLKTLSQFHIHSIEQPIAQRQWSAMRKLVEAQIIPVALDEELIGYDDEPALLLEQIKPEYIILKPSLHGGFNRCNQWIEAAESQHIGWWATSALESNIGLMAIAQWCATKNNSMPQGLGTGSLYLNNIPAPLSIEKACLWHRMPRVL